MENECEEYVTRMEQSYMTAYNVIVGLLEDQPYLTLEDEDIQHLEAVKKILGIINDVYTDIWTTTIGNKKENQK